METLSAGGFEFVMENRDQRADEDGGPSLQVLGMVNGARVELLRFDMFRVQPHYHYAPDGKNLRYSLDPLLVDDGIAWALALISRKLPQLLAKAGYEDLATAQALAGVAAALPDIERRWRTQGGAA